jgi:7-cyano-7-deazaguanine synthase
MPLGADIARSNTPRGDSAPLAVLISGGLDSAILVAEALQHHRAVHPLYVRNGLYWEDVEREYLSRFLAAISRPNLQPLQVLDLPVADLYAEHWSITGRGVPQAGSPDEAVFLPGRNVLLLSKSMLWCHLHGVPALALACLATNPFPDATPAFFTGYQRMVNQAVQGSVAVQLPYAGLSKTAVMQRGRGFPLELTFSCIRPVNGLHCGRCNKCEERRHAFVSADLADGTEYA